MPQGIAGAFSGPRQGQRKLEQGLPVSQEALAPPWPPLAWERSLVHRDRVVSVFTRWSDSGSRRQAWSWGRGGRKGRWARTVPEKLGQTFPGIASRRASRAQQGVCCSSPGAHGRFLSRAGL